MSDNIAKNQIGSASVMPWIAVSQIGKYPQGDITPELFARLENNYDKELIGAPFIAEHRKFNDKGEMQNNLRALAWVEEVKTDGEYLYVKPEAVDDLSWYYDGKSYRYASVEIETVEINGKNEPYLAAIAVTNFPAAKIPKISLQYSQEQKGTVLYGKPVKMSGKSPVRTNDLNPKTEINPEKIIMNEKQIKRLNKILGLDEKADAEKIIEKVETLTKQHKDDNPDNSAYNGKDNRIGKIEERLDAYEKKELEDAIDLAIKEKKFLPSQKEDLLATYAGKIAEFKTFAEKQPALALSANIIEPPETDGKPLTYKKLLNDPALYEKTKTENPALFNRLREQWITDPGKE